MGCFDRKYYFKRFFFLWKFCSGWATLLEKVTLRLGIFKASCGHLAFILAAEIVLDQIIAIL
jgi:hypothetical protein